MFSLLLSLCGEMHGLRLQSKEFRISEGFNYGRSSRVW